MNRKSLLKRGLIFFVLLGGFAHSSDVITNEKIIGAFTADSEVQLRTRAMKQRLIAGLPNCVLGVDPFLRGHLLSASTSTYTANPYRIKAYLVSRHVTCARTANGGTVAHRRSVTARVSVNVRRLPDGSLDEIPTKVVVVDIVDSDLEE